jgi:hypothetical protein
MKIKHWQGYGCLQANVVEKRLDVKEATETLKIEVYGNHEYGIDRSEYWYDVYTWLVQRVSKKHKHIDYTRDLVKDVSFSYTQDKEGAECGIYTVVLKWV